MTIPRGGGGSLDGLGGRGVTPVEGCDGSDELTSLQEPEHAPVGAAEHSSASLDIIEVIDTCAMEVIAPRRREGESVRFFVSAPGQHPSFSDVGFMNQGNTTLLECRMEANHIFSVSGESVDVVYNPAMFGWNSRNISLEAPVVRLLRTSWDDFFSGCRSTTALRLQYCAGDGVFVVRAALQGYLHAHRIFVVAVAPSCAIDPESCFRVRHYRAEGDLTSLCSGSGSEYPEFSVIPRNRESRGAIDLALYSSTFQEFIRCSALGFDFQESSVSMHRDNDLRNLVEESLDEYPRNVFELGLQSVDFFRNGSLIVCQIAIGVLSRGSTALRILAIGIPILRSASMLIRMGVYVIPRNQERFSCWRRLALRSRILNILCLLYESVISIGLLGSGGASVFLVNGLLGYVIVRNVEGIFENTIILCSPLRGRIQDWLTVVSEGDIRTERNENREAVRVGYIARALSSTRDIFAGVSTAVAGLSLAFAIASISNPSSTGSNETESSNTSTTVVLGMVSGVAGAAAVTSIICNVLQIRRMFRRLRGSQGAEWIPLVPSAPPMEDDENIEEIPLSECSPASNPED